MLFTSTLPLFVALFSPLTTLTSAQVKPNPPAAQYPPHTTIQAPAPIPTMGHLSPIGSTNSTTGAAPRYGSYRLDPSFSITSQTTTRRYIFNISSQIAALDGYSKEVLTINGQSPGPLIEANVGDTISVTVINNLPVTTSIHWHGFLQNGTPYMDGVPGTTQCPIPAAADGVPGQFVYEFEAQDYGSFWYHSHSSLQYTDGLHGPMVVHSPDDPLKRGTDFDVEEVVMLADWFHDQAITTIASELLSDGYHGTIAAPPPQSALINGQGVYNCSALSLSTSDDTTGNCTTPSSPPIFAIDSATKYRIRLINSGSHTQFYFSVDSHVLSVVEVDNTPIVATEVNRVPIHNAQRYSVIVDTADDTVGSTFYMRATLNTQCFAYLDPSATLAELAILSVVKGGNTRGFLPSNVTTPTSNDWSDAIGGCVDLDQSLLVPSVIRDPPTSVDQVVVFNSQFGQIIQEGVTLNRFLFNTTSYTNYVYKPMLHEVNSGVELNSSYITHAVFDDASDAVDVVINNLDAFLDHPFHMHGHTFWVMSVGTGTLTYEQATALTYSTDNPLRRDTVTVPASGYAVLRLVSDNPGVWSMHCHIAFHLALGKFAALVEHPSAIQSMTIPSGNLALCNGGDIDDVEPAKRSLPNRFFPKKRRGGNRHPF